MDFRTHLLRAVHPQWAALLDVFWDMAPNGSDWPVQGGRH